MSTTTEKPPAANHTVKRLLALAPGEACVYYRGDFAADIANSKSAPAYAAILDAVHRTARELQSAGRILISEKKIWITTQDQRFKITEYTALGLAGGSADALSDDEVSGDEAEATV
jgi:hypothetical protein